MNDVQFQITIRSGNQAVVDDPQGEVCRILQDVAAKVMGGDDAGRVRDLNGNHVGDWWMETDDG